MRETACIYTYILYIYKYFSGFNKKVFLDPRAHTAAISVSFAEASRSFLDHDRSRDRRSLDRLIVQEGLREEETGARIGTGIGGNN